MFEFERHCDVGLGVGALIRFTPILVSPKNPNQETAHTFWLTQNRTSQLPPQTVIVQMLYRPDGNKDSSKNFNLSYVTLFTLVLCWVFIRLLIIVAFALPSLHFLFYSIHCIIKSEFQKCIGLSGGGGRGGLNGL